MFLLIVIIITVILYHSTIVTCIISDGDYQQQKHEEQKPSFLFMLVDDIGWSDFSYNGGNVITPNIDTWAARMGSIKMMDFHSAGTICSPTRASVLTGRNPLRDCVDTVYGYLDMTAGVPDFEFSPSNTFTVGDAVKSLSGHQYDYDDGSFFAGKWHLGSFYNNSEELGGITSSPITHGFDYFNATLGKVPTMYANCHCFDGGSKTCKFGHYGNNAHGGYCGTCCSNYWFNNPLLPHGVGNISIPTPPNNTEYLTDTFSRFLSSRKRASTGEGGQEQGKPPFFAQISFHECHVPFIGSEEAKSSCLSGETCKLPAEGELPYTDEELNYYACILQLDAAIGDMITILDEEGYYDNTLIWFASDNGPEKNCYNDGICKRANDAPQRPSEGPGSAGLLRGRKRDVWEGGHRVPGIISWPAEVKGDAGQVSWQTASTTDFLPTVMEILGVTRPVVQQGWAMDGRSILPILRQDPSNPFTWENSSNSSTGGMREMGIAYYNHRTDDITGWSYRYGPWKYVENSFSCQSEWCKKPQLYNLDYDLGERNNLADTMSDILQDIQSRFQLWHESIVTSRTTESNCQHVKKLKFDLPGSLLSNTDDDEEEPPTYEPTSVPTGTNQYWWYPTYYPTYEPTTSYYDDNDNDQSSYPPSTSASFHPTSSPSNQVNDNVISSINDNFNNGKPNQSSSSKKSQQYACHSAVVVAMMMNVVIIVFFIP